MLDSLQFLMLGRNPKPSWQLSDAFVCLHFQTFLSSERQGWLF